MKSLMRVVVVALALSPLAALAQQNQPVTRAQVKEDLKQLENAGYNPSERDAYYPSNLQAAEAKVQSAGGTAYGPSSEGSSASGQPATNSQ
jgi:hypothetical protein